MTKSAESGGPWPARHRSDAGALQRRAPGSPPAALDAGEPGQRHQREAGEDQEAGRGAAGELLGKAERRREVEPADAPGEADEAGHHPDLLAEALRHELE